MSLFWVPSRDDGGVVTAAAAAAVAAAAEEEKGEEIGVPEEGAPRSVAAVVGPLPEPELAEMPKMYRIDDPARDSIPALQKIKQHVFFRVRVDGRGCMLVTTILNHEVCGNIDKRGAARSMVA